MTEKKHYDSSFFKTNSEGSYPSAKLMVPELVQLFNPKSLVDIGCGLGEWLKVFEENGVKDILGVDGEYVNESKLYIDKTKFLNHDLKQPFQLNRKFDLCISFEVAEHLPATSAETFVDSLTKLSDVILFSAAIPMQLGTYHINEQYPEYWANLFDRKGYAVADCIRPMFWNNEKISYYYKQNVLAFVKKDCIDQFPVLQKSVAKSDKDYLTKIHPGIFEYKRFYRWVHFTLYTFSKLTGIKLIKI